MSSKPRNVVALCLSRRWHFASFATEIRVGQDPFRDATQADWFFSSAAKKSFLGQNKSFWGALELVEKLTPEAGEITASVKDLPGLKSVDVPPSRVQSCAFPQRSGRRFLSPR